ncbi:MAG: restriction endonuclease [Thermodesulfobacteriota bacterium]
MTDSYSSLVAVLSASDQWWSRLRKRFDTQNTPITSLLMQAVVEKGDKTNEGELITAVTLPFFRIIEAILKDPNIAYQMTPRMWEEMVAGIHERSGLFDEVILTPRSGDHGRDVIAIKRGIYSLRIIDQVKAYNPGHVVTADEIRSTIGVLHGENTNKAIVTTTSRFSPLIMKDPAIKDHVPYRLELRDGDMLRKILIELSNKK